MDPDEALRQIRELVARCQDGDGSAEDAAQLAQLFDGLDMWLVAGGYVPAAWRYATGGAGR